MCWFPWLWSDIKAIFRYQFWGINFHLWTNYLDFLWEWPQACFYFYFYRYVHSLLTGSETCTHSSLVPYIHFCHRVYKRSKQPWMEVEIYILSFIWIPTRAECGFGRAQCTNVGDLWDLCNAFEAHLCYMSQIQWPPWPQTTEYIFVW